MQDVRVCRQMRLPRLDVVLGLATPAIDVIIKPARVALVEVCDDEARVGPLRASLDPCDHPLDAAPAFGAVVKFLKPRVLPCFGVAS